MAEQATFGLWTIIVNIPVKRCKALLESIEACHGLLRFQGRSPAIAFGDHIRHRVACGLRFLLLGDAMKILVCGGRGYDDFAKVFNTLDQYQDRYGPLTIIQGAAKTGADKWAREWTYRQSKVTLIDVPAAWSDLSHRVSRIKRLADGTLYDTAAGPRRNAEMLDEKPDIILAFPGGKGTADMTKRAKAAGIPVIAIE